MSAIAGTKSLWSVWVIAFFDVTFAEVLDELVALFFAAFAAVLCDLCVLSLRRVFSDVHNFVFEDKKIGLPLTRQPDHILVVVLNPAAHHFSISQLDADRLLLFSQGLQVSCLFRCLGRRRSSSLLAGWSFSMEWHKWHCTRAFQGGCRDVPHNLAC